MQTTELQRLREVRLCNVNSLCLTGGANINRFEHAIGTCYLALECLKYWPNLNPINDDERRQLVIAALLHDTLNAPLGHSIEYTESKDGYEPEKHLQGAVTEGYVDHYYYRRAKYEPVFFKTYGNVIDKLSKGDLLAVSNIMSGKGRLGPLINGTIDLDNIDNVFRFAYHLGIIKTGKTALDLAKSIYIEGGHLTVKQEAKPLIEKWFDVRKRLYSFLLLNPQEFSAKCMLEEAFEFAKDQKFAYSWHDTDYEFLTNLNNLPAAQENFQKTLFTLSSSFAKSFNEHLINAEVYDQFEHRGYALSSKLRIEDLANGWKVTDNTKVYLVERGADSLTVFKCVPRAFDISATVRRIMTGDLYGCIGIFSSSKIEERSLFKDVTRRRSIENRASEIIRTLKGRFGKAIVVFHLIEDRNKTQRKISIRTSDGSTVNVGQSLNRLLIGAFFRNQHLSMHDVNPCSHEMEKVRSNIYKYLSSVLKEQDLSELPMYGEATMYAE